MIETITLLNLIRLGIGVSILSYASYTDIKTRRASNVLWLIMGLAGGVLLIVQYLTVGFENYYYLLFIPVMIALFYVLFQIGLIFGGADAKALMAISILAPIQPSILNYPLSKTLLPFSFVIFVNSLLIFLVIPISLSIYNLSKKDLRFPHMFLGYRIEISEARKRFVWPLEKIVDGKLKLSTFPEDFDADKEYNNLENHGFKTIWVTPKVPFMVPLLIGYIVSFIFGDIISFLVGFSSI